MKMVDGVEIIEFRHKEDWVDYASSSSVRIRRSAELELIRSPYPASLPGICGCCGKLQNMSFGTWHSRLTERGGIELALSETGSCPECRINSRMRFASDILRSHFAETRGSVYLTERKTNFFTALSAIGHSLVGSEFLGSDKNSGEEYDGIIHQDVTKLTYPESSFQAVVCLDVVEHVHDPLAAVLELHRVLSPGGVGIVTFPFFPYQERTVVRCQIKDDGTVEHLLPAVYHGNPLGGGALVFNDLSWDFWEKVKENLVGYCRLVNYWSLYRCHFGMNRFALILSKK
ncbi:class I SAM-dependent methyltransferase [Azospirillum sp. A1-3]|uniref:class I SAM-dependent methyltransferase n=1 Tax=Azospirillum sp. A1-3 TaxID=185874 RepID=UPI00207782E2|nr:class I SAM-dependent methyltransferase [Azospirillum sp. A1-3]MCM8738908.1 class I SAM-dependent methyltransferase [Azospirillum sp. A1-3]